MLHNNIKCYQRPEEFITIEDQGNNIIKNSSLPFINIKIGSIDFSCLIDTGAEITLLREEKAKIIPKIEGQIVKIKGTDIIAANKRKLGTITKRVCLDVTINNKEYVMQFYVIEKLQYDVIVGMDNINLLGMKLDFEEGWIRIKENVIRYEKELEEMDTFPPFLAMIQQKDQVIEKKDQVIQKCNKELRQLEIKKMKNLEN